MSNMLEMRDVSLTLRNRRVLNNICLNIKQGEFVGLLGANGAGKSSLMRAALGLLTAQGYSSLAAMPPSKRVKKVAWIAQSREIVWPMSVERLVALGRLPHLAHIQHSLSLRDQAAVDAAISRMQLAPLRDRIACRLSGGEQARVLIARALAQETPLLMADEPAAGLDPAHQIATMQLFAKLAAEGYTVFIALHDLGLAARYCNRLILLADGAVLADGAPSDVLTNELMAQAFGISIWRSETPFGTFLQVLDVI